MYIWVILHELSSYICMCTCMCVSTHTTIKGHEFDKGWESRGDMGGVGGEGSRGRNDVNAVLIY